MNIPNISINQYTKIWYIEKYQYIDNFGEKNQYRIEIDIADIAQHYLSL